ncbi:MAG: Glutamate--tRNA ligase 1 [candidate division WS2 bacterium]|nr:Glutamate--tRNA ligase 1 [Candidatus Lithacetigena glycinireducens]
MKNTDIRVRFAPSPTGFMHIGNARTALYNYLFARNQKGKFILRIEDTDVERSTPEAREVIFSSLRFLGIEWDEGPYYQSERVTLYQEYAEELLKKGVAYKCYCQPQELEQRRRETQVAGKPYKYERTCYHLTPEEKQQKTGLPFAIRFLVPPGEVSFPDLIRGNITFKGEELEDFVLLRSDGTPTYNFACVIDDYSMKITQVIRGEDHIPNTPKQILIYEACKWEPPLYAHLPMIMGPDHAKLSKRHGATSVEAYREMGYLPEALVNALAMLGASFEADREIYRLGELISLFSLNNVSKKAAVFEPEKLKWFNREHIKLMTTEDLLSRLLEWGFKSDDKNYLSRVLTLVKERITVLGDVHNEFIYFFQEPKTYDDTGLITWSSGEVLENLGLLKDKLSELLDFSALSIEKTFRSLADERSVKAKELIHPLRLVLTGKTVSPGLFEMMEVLGRTRVVTRIEAFLAKIKQINS